MRTERIPMVGSTFQRQPAGDYNAARDQRLVNCMFRRVQNPASGNSVIRCEKRPGFTKPVLTGMSATADGRAIIYWSRKNNIAGSVGADVFVGTAFVEAASGACRGMTPMLVSGVEVILMSMTDNTAWIVTDSATATFTASTNSNTTLTAVSSFTGLYVGQTVTGTNIPANTRITALNSGTSEITISNATTGTTAGVTVTRSALAKITSANFPGNSGRTTCGQFVALDGYAYIMDTGGRVWNSDLNDPTAWTSTNYLTVQNPGYGVSLMLSQNYVVAATRTAIEAYTNTGNASGSPLSFVRNASTPIGLADGNAAAGYFASLRPFVYSTVGVYFIGVSRSGKRAVYLLTGATVAKVSPEHVDEYFEINTVAAVSCCSMLGKELLFVLTRQYESDGVTTNNTIWAYDADLQLWSEFDFNTDSNTIWPVEFAYRGVDPASFANIAIGLVDEEDAKLLQFRSEKPVYTDVGQSYTRTMQVGGIDFGTARRKTMHRLRLVGDQQSTAWSISLEFSDDDGATYSTARTVDMSAQDPSTTRLGAFRRRVIKFTDTNNGPGAIESMDIEYSEAKS